jgi:hypothetical protein
MPLRWVSRCRLVAQSLPSHPLLLLLAAGSAARAWLSAPRDVLAPAGRLLRAGRVARGRAAFIGLQLAPGPADL